MYTIRSHMLQSINSQRSNSIQVSRVVKVHLSHIFMLSFRSCTLTFVIQGDLLFVAVFVQVVEVIEPKTRDKRIDELLQKYHLVVASSRLI